MTDTNPPPTLTQWRARKQTYRHACNRRLFDGILPPGTRIEVRCPKCGQMHVISIPPLSLNGTGNLAVNGTT